MHIKSSREILFRNFSAAHCRTNEFLFKMHIKAFFRNLSATHRRTNEFLFKMHINCLCFISKTGENFAYELCLELDIILLIFCLLNCRQFCSQIAFWEVSSDISQLDIERMNFCSIIAQGGALQQLHF